MKKAVKKNRPITLKQSILVSITHFVSSTSIRGLPRILKSETRGLKVLWFFFTVISFVTLIYLIVSMVFGYMDYDIVIQTTSDSTHRGRFPAVSLCYNMAAFSEYAYNDKFGPEEFGRFLVTETEKMVGKIGVYKNETDVQISDLLHFDDTHYFLETYLNQIIHKKSYKEPRIFCYHQTKDQSLSVAGSCNILTYPTASGQHLDSGYFHCYTVKIEDNDEKTHGTSLLLDMTFTFPKALWQNRSRWFKGNFEAQLQGLGNTMQIHLHPREEPPDFHDSGFPVLMDKILLVIFKKHQHIRDQSKNKKQSCVDDPKYSQLACRRLAEVQQIRRRCRCQYGGWLFTVPTYAKRDANSTYYMGEEDIDMEPLPMCKNLSAALGGPNTVKKNVICAESIRDQIRADLTSYCPMPCKHDHFGIERIFPLDLEKDNLNAVTYRVKRARELQKYLRSIAAMDTINDIIGGGGLFGAEEDTTQKPHEGHIENVDEEHRELREKLRCEIHNNQSDCFGPIDADEAGTSEGDISKRFYLWLSRSNEEDVIRTEKLVITKERLLSQIGGLCSLFVGLTLTVFAEFLEFIYRIFIPKATEEERLNTTTFDENRLLYTPSDNNKQNSQPACI